MATSYREFRIELYEEHLEDASFIYEQRLGLFHDPEITWFDIEEFEERLEAHIDALVVGEDLALEICQRQVEEGDFGELYAAVCVFCRQGRRDLLSTVLKELDPDDEEQVGAVSDALKDEMSSDWANALIGGLDRGFEKLIPLFARYVGYRRLPVGDVLKKIIDKTTHAGLERILWSLGRVGSNAAIAQMRAYLDHEDAAVRTSAAIALLRQADGLTFELCRKRAEQNDGALFIPLAVSGRKADAEILHRIAAGKVVDPDAITALGILGNLSTVRLLVEKLEDDALSESAANALQLITGAGLREEAFIPEEVNEDELFEEELKVYLETGEAPKYLDGRPFGVNVERISQDPKEWRDWLTAHKAEFDAKQRYRLGKPYSPATLVDTLVSESSNYLLRSLAYEELVIRYGIDIPFEADMPVVQQKLKINDMANLVHTNEATYQPGQWYFAGQPMP